MTKILLSNPINAYSRTELDYFCEPNEEMEVELVKVEKLKYIKIRNFLKRPIELRDFISQFPTEDTYRSMVESTYKEDRSASTGLQQMMDDRFVSKITEKLYKIMFKHGMVHYENSILLWDYYTNLFYPGMKMTRGNNYPHIDPFSFAANIYLSEVNDCKTGTNFFKCQFTDPETGEPDIFYNLFELKSPLRNKHNYIPIFEKYRESHTMEEDISNLKYFSTFQGDDFYKKYHFAPAEFNSVSLYKGCHWHNIEYDSEKSKQLRYSLVGAVVNRANKDKMNRQLVLSSQLSP